MLKYEIVLLFILLYILGRFLVIQKEKKSLILLMLDPNFFHCRMKVICIMYVLHTSYEKILYDCLISLFITIVKHILFKFYLKHEKYP